MTEQHISYDCADCDSNVTTPRGSEIENLDGQLICEDCDKPDWEQLDFPLWFDYPVRMSKWEPLRLVSEETGIDEDDIQCKRDLKYADSTHVWYKITQYGVEGPYDEKEGELL